MTPYARHLALLEVASFGTMAALRICDPLLPSLAQDFRTSTGDAGQVVYAFALSYGLALLAYGPLGERFGKFRVITLATLACAVSSLACIAAPSLGTLVGLRVVSGFAAAGVTPLAMAWIGDAVPYERRQAVLARLIGATTLGMIVAQWAGGVLADTAGWRSAFVALALLFGAAAAFMLRELRSESGIAAPKATPRKTYIGMIGEVLHQPWARHVLMFSLVEGLLVFGGLAFLPAHLNRRFDLPMSWAGAVLALYGLGGLIYSILAPRLLTLLGEIGLARTGGILMSCYFTTLVFLPNWIWALPACFLGGLGFYMLHNTLQTHATQMAPNARSTSVTLFSAMLFLGQSLGVTVCAMVFDAYSADPVFIASAIGLPLLAFVFAAQTRPQHPPMKPPNRPVPGGTTDDN